MKNGETLVQIMPADGWVALYKSGAQVALVAFGLTSKGKVVPLIPDWQGEGLMRTAVGFADASEKNGFRGIGKGKERLPGYVEPEEDGRSYSITAQPLRAYQ